MHERERTAPDTEREPERPPLRATPPASAETLLNLQRSAGNAAVARALLARQPQTAPAATGTARRELREGMKDDPDVELLQLKLNYHLGYLGQQLLHVDGWFGGKTARALRAVKRARGHRPVNARVDEPTWDMLDEEPQARSPQRGGEGGAGPAPEYGRMLEDGLLDITLAVGYDEHGINHEEYRQLRRGLVDVRRFRPDDARARTLRANAQRPEATGEGEWLVKENIGTWAGGPVHATLRLIGPAPTDGSRSGAGAQAGALQGMGQSDVFAYSGHARHGTGPDFDRNYAFVVHWDRHPSAGGRTGDQELTAEAQIVEVLGLRGSDADKIQQFDALLNSRVVERVDTSAGNIGVNPQPLASHARTFSAHLMTVAARGQAQPIAGAARERRYRLWLFNACTTQDYVDTIRAQASSNAALGSRELDMTTTGNLSWLASISETTLTYLDGIMSRETAAALEERLEAQPRFRSQAATDYRQEGFGDNP